MEQPSWEMPRNSLMRGNLKDKRRHFLRFMGCRLGLFFTKALKKNVMLKTRELGDKEWAHLVNTDFY